MMTNGEKIKEIFPYLENDKRDLVKVLNIDNLKNWWNSEYQEPTNENDLDTINGLDDFIEFGRKAFGVELTIKKSDNPDTYEKLFGTTKDDLADDCISRADAIRVASGYCHPSNVAKELAKLPSVTPRKPQTFKWCTTCKEYDQEKHCCHRWSKVIRNTVEELKQEYIERDILDKLRAELHATAEMHDDGDYYLREEWIDEYFDKYKADMEDKK